VTPEIAKRCVPRRDAAKSSANNRLIDKRNPGDRVSKTKLRALANQSHDGLRETNVVSGYTNWQSPASQIGLDCTKKFVS
jgi:hypothetical protein